MRLRRLHRTGPAGHPASADSVRASLSLRTARPVAVDGGNGPAALLTEAPEAFLPGSLVAGDIPRHRSSGFSSLNSLVGTGLRWRVWLWANWVHLEGAGAGALPTACTVAVYPLCTPLWRRYRFWRFCRFVESATCVLSVGLLGSSPARLTRPEEVHSPKQVPARPAYLSMWYACFLAHP